MAWLQTARDKLIQVLHRNVFWTIFEKLWNLLNEKNIFFTPNITWAEREIFRGLFINWELQGWPPYWTQRSGNGDMLPYSQSFSNLVSSFAKSHVRTCCDTDLVIFLPQIQLHLRERKQSSFETVRVFWVSYSCKSSDGVSCQQDKYTEHFGLHRGRQSWHLQMGWNKTVPAERN